MSYYFIREKHFFCFLYFFRLSSLLKINKKAIFWYYFFLINTNNFVKNLHSLIQSNPSLYMVKSEEFYYFYSKYFVSFNFTFCSGSSGKRKWLIFCWSPYSFLVNYAFCSFWKNLTLMDLNSIIQSNNDYFSWTRQCQAFPHSLFITNVKKSFYSHCMFERIFITPQFKNGRKIIK